MSIKSRDQLKKAQPKDNTTSQGQSQDLDKDNQAKQGVKASKIVRKDKKQRAHQAKQDRDY